MVTLVANQFPARQGESIFRLLFPVNHALLEIDRDDDGSIS